eukprot:2727142-Rhodomonas_salina.1
MIDTCRDELRILQLLAQIIRKLQCLDLKARDVESGSVPLSRANTAGSHEPTRFGHTHTHAPTQLWCKLPVY